MENEAKAVDTQLALLEQKIVHLEKDAEKREKLQDARHSETMSKLAERDRLHDARHAESMASLSELKLSVLSTRNFNQGVTATVRAAWAAVGGIVVGGAMLLINKVMTP